MYGHYRSWQGEEYGDDTIPMFYAGATDEMGEIVATLSREAIEVAHAIDRERPGAVDLRSVVPVHDWLRSSYAHVTADMSTVATCFRTGPIQARKAPVTEIAPGRFVPNFDYRYLTEDVPYGLVITRGLAELAGVPTPTIDEVIEWAQAAMGRSYLVGGTLSGADAKDVPIPQNYGISELAALFEWYDEASAPSTRLVN